MQKTRKEKSLMIRKTELTNLLNEAVEHHNHVEAARAAVANAQQMALFHAWQAGIRLNNMKRLVGHGNWQNWCELNFCKPFGVSDRTVRLYMKIDADNAHLRDLPPNRQRVADLRFDTIRKYAYALIPEKSQPNKEGDIKLPRFVSFFNIVNEYERVKNRHLSGLERVNFEMVRNETVELYQFLRCVHGDDSRNPWEASPSRRT
jgi:Protein of unknown function (DUF3102).